MQSPFFELLQVALDNRRELSQTLSNKEWRNVFVEAQRQAIVGVLFDGLEKLPQEQRPQQDLLLQCIGITQTIEKNALLHQVRTQELTTLFKKYGYSSCVLKGVGLAQLYDNPLHRQGGDIDIWVDGPRDEIMDFLKKGYLIKEIRWHHVDCHFFDDVQTEVHFHATWLFNPCYDRKLQKFICQSKQSIMNVDTGDLGYVFPSVEFNSVYSLVHSFHHLLESGIGIRHVVDYYYIVKSLSPENREEILSVISSIGLMRFLTGLMWVLQETCGLSPEYLLCPPNEKDGKFLLEDIMKGGNFGHYRNGPHGKSSIGRMISLLPYYPNEVLWIIPWKLWHKCWRLVNG